MKACNNVELEEGEGMSSQTKFMLVSFYLDKNVDVALSLCMM